MNIKRAKRIYRHKRIRKVINGTSERPRLCVHRSLRGLSAQVIDDTVGKIIFGKSTQSKELKGKIKNGGNIEAAKVLERYLQPKRSKKALRKFPLTGADIFTMAGSRPLPMRFEKVE